MLILTFLRSSRRTKSCLLYTSFSSVMIDGSHLPYEENVALTKKVVDYAHQFDVTVEGELGVLAGVEDEVSSDHHTYTDPEEVIDFATRTGCDSLAISIGTSHGAYKFTPEQCHIDPKTGKMVPPPLAFEVLDLSLIHISTSLIVTANGPNSNTSYFSGIFATSNVMQTSLSLCFSVIVPLSDIVSLSWFPLALILDGVMSLLSVQAVTSGYLPVWRISLPSTWIEEMCIRDRLITTTMQNRYLK